MAYANLNGARPRADHPAPMSAADVAAHELASYVRRPASKSDQIDAAYVERDRQRRAMVTAERAVSGAL